MSCRRSSLRAADWALQVRRLRGCSILSLRSQPRAPLPGDSQRERRSLWLNFPRGAAAFEGFVLSPGLRFPGRWLFPINTMSRGQTRVPGFVLGCRREKPCVGRGKPSPWAHCGSELFRELCFDGHAQEGRVRWQLLQASSSPGRGDTAAPETKARRAVAFFPSPVLRGYFCLQPRQQP